LPSIGVSLVNLDIEKVDVPFQPGGDYRSGRQARWRIEATDSKGKVFTRTDWEGGLMGGGLSSTGRLKFKEEMRNGLSLSQFVPTLVPGSYTIRIFYSDSVCIADTTCLDGLILCQSDVTKLIVDPPKLHLTPETRRAIERELAKIDGTGHLKIIAGTYGQWAHDFVAPDSPQAKILQMGMDAIPVLIDALDNPKLDVHRRAEILSLLFSLTGENDPRDYPWVIGGYSAMSGPWSVRGEGFGAFMSGSEDVAAIQPINEESQKDFSLKWKPWREYFSYGK
jgi:hypothetical protein